MTEITLDVETLLPIVAPAPKAAPKTPPPDPKPQPKRRGRPTASFTDEQIRDIERLSPYLTQRQLAELLKIPLRTLERLIEKSPEVKASIESGRAAATGAVAESLLKSALSGNLGAQIFWLKCRGGWKDGSGSHTAGIVGDEQGTTTTPLRITPEFEAEVRRIAERQAALVPPLKFSQTTSV